MSRPLDREAELEARLRDGLPTAFPTKTLSPELSRRLAVLVTGAEAAPGSPAGRSRQWTRWGLALAATAVVVVIAGTQLVRPPLAAAAVLERMEARVEDVRSAHMRRWMVTPDGARRKQGELWFQAGKWRWEQEQPRQVGIFSNGTLWSYRPERNEIAVGRRASPFSHHPSGLTFGAVLRDFTLQNREREIRVERSPSVDGEATVLIAVEAAGSPERMLFRVDRKTDLPVRVDAQLREGTGWVTRLVIDLAFDQPLPASLFIPSFPEGARRVELEPDPPASKG